MVNDQEHKRSAANVLGTALDKNLKVSQHFHHAVRKANLKQKEVPYDRLCKKVFQSVQ